MPVFTKTLLSSSTWGKNIPVTTVNGTYTLVHTAVSGVSALDEVYLYTFNNFGSTIPVTISWGGTTVSDQFTVNVPSNGNGRLLIVDGRLLQNGQTIQASTTQAGTNGIFIEGFVHRIQ